MIALPRKRGLLLINLGTPQAPTQSAVYQYLAEFLSDKRVVSLPALFWKPLLKTIILPFRSRRSARLYQSIWMNAGAPLAVYSKKLAEGVQEILSDTFKVVLSMRYGEPSIQAGLSLLQKAGVQSIVVLPLYPQYSTVTTASCFDVVTNLLRQSCFIPTLRFISSYFDHPFYIHALVDRIKTYWSDWGKKVYWLFSFHGIPARYSQLGDPYEQQCYRTAHLIAEQLRLSFDAYQVVFQSRFGKAIWLQPYCDKTLEQLVSKGVKDIAIVCPGFAVDCLETLEEISQRYKKMFIKRGGQNFYYIPALNESKEQCQFIAGLAKDSLP